MAKGGYKGEARKREKMRDKEAEQDRKTGNQDERKKGRKGATTEKQVNGLRLEKRNTQTKISST